MALGKFILYSNETEVFRYFFYQNIHESLVIDVNYYFDLFNSLK